MIRAARPLLAGRLMLCSASWPICLTQSWCWSAGIRSVASASGKSPAAYGLNVWNVFVRPGVLLDWFLSDVKVTSATCESRGHIFSLRPFSSLVISWFLPPVHVWFILISSKSGRPWKAPHLLPFFLAFGKVQLSFLLTVSLLVLVAFSYYF